MKKLSCLLKKLPRAAIFLMALGLSSLCFGAGSVLDRVVEQGVLKVGMSGNLGWRASMATASIRTLSACLAPTEV